MIGLDESSDHEIDNIETIHLDESNENEEIEERFRSNLRRVSFWRVRKNQTSKEFCRLDDSIPYLDNAE